MIKVIDYVDGVGTKPAGVDDADIETVREARNLTYLIGTSMTAVIPSYSKKAEMAKGFLKYLFSDESARIVIDSNCGSQLPITTDFSTDTQLMSSLSPLERSRVNIFANDDMFYNSRKHPIVSMGGLAPFSYRVTIEKAFGGKNASDRISPQDYYMYDYNYYTANNGAAWNNLLKNSAITVG